MTAAAAVKKMRQSTLSSSIKLQKISDTESESDSDDDLDVMAMLSNKKSKSITNLVAKRPALFETDETTGFKKLKPPPKNAFSARFSKTASLLDESAELSKLNEEDNKEALKLLEEDDAIKRKIQNSLCKEALQDEEYVTYIINHYEELNLEDFHYIGKPTYVKAVKRPPIEMFCFYNPKRKWKGDLFNELNENVIEQLEFDMRYIEIDDFFPKIGVSAVNLKLETITKADFTIDPILPLQDMRLILVKVKKYIDAFVTTEFTDAKFRRIFKILGFMLIDKKMHATGNKTLATQIVENLLQWGLNATKEVKIKDVIDVWNSISVESKLLYRLIESLSSIRSTMIEQLKLQLTMSIVNIGAFEFRYFQDMKELTEAVNKALVKELKQLVFVNFNDPLLDHVTLRIKFQCVLILIRRAKDAFDEKQLQYNKSIGEYILEIQKKVPLGLASIEMASLRAVIIILATLVGQ